MARSSHHKSQPVTPQRIPQQRPAHRYSSSQSFYRSPVTPASPYTPLSLRSFTSSTTGISSTLTTPDHHAIKGNLSFSPNVASPSMVTNNNDHSLADLRENWRSRASENGIKVSSMNDDSHFGDDEASDQTASDIANDSIFISAEEAFLAPSLISSERRTVFAPNNRPRAHSHLPTHTARSLASPVNTHPATRHFTQPASPLASRRVNQSQNANVTSTPPQNRALARQLKLKGSLTDPAHTRRREAFSPVWTPAQHNANNNVNQSFTFGLNPDTSLDLFDIDENDFENEFDYAHDQSFANDSLMEQRFHSKNNTLNNNLNALNYPNYALPLLPSYTQQPSFPMHSQAPFSDPFNGNALSSITESVEHFFHTQQQFQDPNIYSHGPSEASHRTQSWGAGPKLGVAPAIGLRDGYMGGPAWVPVPAPPSFTPTKSTEVVKPVSKPAESKKNAPPASGCSVCLAASPRTLAILAPCGHPLCSGCLTSALNIVGEKDMECAVCHGKVQDFKLVSGDGPKVDATASSATSNQQRGSGSRTPEENGPKSFMEPLFSSPESAGAGGLHALESAFEFGLGLENARASTPKREERSFSSFSQQKAGLDGQNGKQGRKKGKNDESTVLRIDNVPWDITPPQIRKWLQQPLERIHVLLDKRGKTMSHAYVEVADVAVAGKILRGEAQGEPVNDKPRERGSVLGKGRRARGVTVTRSGQEELMSDLFPNWRGSFDGSRPSLAGLGNDQVISALEGGLIGETEVVGLLHLIKEPDSHFLKAPSLPFYSLISILSKFPSDVDSRVFWSSTVRDTLYDIAYAAVQMLLSRVNPDAKTGDNEYSMELVNELVNTALSCHAFTTQQLSKFSEFLELCSTPASNPIQEGHSGSESGGLSQPKTPENSDTFPAVSNAATAVVEDDVFLPVSDGEDKEALAKLAREFGVEAELVEALAQRLAGLC